MTKPIQQNVYQACFIAKKVISAFQRLGDVTAKRTVRMVRVSGRKVDVGRATDDLNRDKKRDVVGN